MRKPRDPVKEGSTTAREIMTPYVIKLGVDALFEDVITMLYDYVITAVFLYDKVKNEYFIIENPDIVKFLKEKGLKMGAQDLSKVPARDVMRGPIKLLDVSITIDNVIRYMTEHRHKQVLISEHGDAIGVITTRNIFKWNKIYFKPSRPQVLLFMDKLTSNSIGKYIFYENIDEEIQKGLIDLFGGALQSVSMMTEEIISKSGELSHVVKDKRSILFEPYHNITGVLICDFNSINLRHRLEEATQKFAEMHPEIIQTGPVSSLKPINRVFTASVEAIANIFKEIQ